MFIQHIDGIELEKEKPNTSEDFFNRSEATFDLSGNTHTFHLLYVRYFEEKLQEELTHQDFWKNHLNTFKIREIAALAALSSNSAFLKRKRVYINDYEEFKNLFLKADEEFLTTELDRIKKNK
jgi:hypothetical protein